MTTLNDLNGYLDDEAYTVCVGELRALLTVGIANTAKPYERHDPDTAPAPFLSFIPDAKRDELIGALLASLERNADRETDFYTVRSFIGGLGLLAAQFAPSPAESIADTAGAKPDDTVLVALKAARGFIINGTTLGYIRMPDADLPDPAHNTLPMIEAAIASLTTPAPSVADADERDADDWLIDKMSKMLAEIASS